jgi:hypothetical protein
MDYGGIKAKTSPNTAEKVTEKYRGKIACISVW